MGLFLLLTLGFGTPAFGSGCGDLIASAAVQELTETFRRARHTEDRWFKYVGDDSALARTAFEILVDLATRPDARIAEAELMRETNDRFRVGWESLRRSIAFLRRKSLVERITGGRFGPTYGLTRDGEDTIRNLATSID